MHFSLTRVFSVLYDVRLQASGIIEVCPSVPFRQTTSWGCSNTSWLQRILYRHRHIPGICGRRVAMVFSLTTIVSSADGMASTLIFMPRGGGCPPVSRQLRQQNSSALTRTRRQSTKTPCVQKRELIQIHMYFELGVLVVRWET